MFFQNNYKYLVLAYLGPRKNLECKNLDVSNLDGTILERKNLDGTNLEYKILKSVKIWTVKI